MARRRHTKTKRKTSRRRSRVGAIKAGGIMGAVTIIAGAVAASQVSKLIAKAIPATMSAKTSGLISGAAPIVLGLFLPKIIKSDVGKNLGTGMIAAGGLNLVKSTIPSLAGVGGDYYMNKPAPSISGYQTSTAGNYLAGIAALEEMEGK
jgi:hypothetical protein